MNYQRKVRISTGQKNAKKHSKKKKGLLSDLALTPYDPKRKLIIVAIANEYGIELYCGINLRMGQRNQLFMHPDLYYQQ